MPRTSLFISHISENADVAKVLKDFISERSMHGVEVFVSSDGDIKPGEEWQNMIINRIRASDVVLVLCTNASIFRPWVNFEAGGAIVRGATVIPVCWHGATRGTIPPPLGHYQAIDLGDEKQVRELMVRIGTKASLDLSRVDPQLLIKQLPPRLREYVDISPRMALGFDSAIDHDSRLAREYQLARRRDRINLASEYRIRIERPGPALFTFSQEVIFLEQPKTAELRETLACRTGADFNTLRYSCDDSTVTRWERLNPTTISVHLLPKVPIRALKPFRHAFSWVPPMDWGDEFDSISFPVEVPTNEHRISVESDLPIEHAVAFKDPDPLPDDQRQLAIKALGVTRYQCPPPTLETGRHVTWAIELPEPQAVYRLILYYAGARKKLLGSA